MVLLNSIILSVVHVPVTVHLSKHLQLKLETHEIFLYDCFLSTKILPLLTCTIVTWPVTNTIEMPQSSTYFIPAPYVRLDDLQINLRCLYTVLHIFCITQHESVIFSST